MSSAFLFRLKMLFPYIQNLLGVKLEDEDFENIKHPYGEMYFHVTLKTVQIGTTLGTLVIAPIIAGVTKSNRNMKGLKRCMLKSGKVGAMVGLVAGRYRYITVEFFFEG